MSCKPHGRNSSWQEPTQPRTVPDPRICMRLFCIRRDLRLAKLLEMLDLLGRYETSFDMPAAANKVFFGGRQIKTPFRLPPRNNLPRSSCLPSELTAFCQGAWVTTLSPQYRSPTVRFVLKRNRKLWRSVRQTAHRPDRRSSIPRSRSVQAFRAGRLTRNTVGLLYR